MREKGQTEVAKTLETPVFSRGIEILTEKNGFSKIIKIFGFALRHPIGSRIVPVGMGISKENGVLLCLGGPEGIGSPLRGESKETVGFVAHDFPSESLVCYTFVYCIKHGLSVYSGNL